MKNFTYTIFLSAFLLFLVQPMIARFILPWYGGSSAVWSTCILFFQAGLLIGYGYVHLIVQRFNIQNQVKIHLVLLIISLISIPIIPKEWMKPDAFSNPVTGILFLLTLTVGFPYILLSTTGPLMQYWFSISNPKKSPYRLYALSNLGSLIGLLAYPVVVEPLLNLKTQAWCWTAGYILFILFCGMIARNIWKINAIVKNASSKTISTVNAETKILWLLFAFMGTVTLLSITNKLTQDTVVIPFLWIIPLSLYLISFIIAFEKPSWYNRKIFIPLLLIITGIILNNQVRDIVFNKTISVTSTVLQYCFGVFVLCMVLHGELARKKPAENKLTLFYFIISIGGVLGGVFINIVVPYIFKNYWEIYSAFLGTIMLLGYVLFKTESVQKNNRLLIAITSLGVIGGVVFAFGKEYKNFNQNIVESSRNFYGVVKVSEENKGKSNWQRTLTHGNILHGVELMDSISSYIPFTYYVPESGIGLVLSQFPTRADSGYKGMKVGVIGLGIGTVSAYGTVKDTYKYYEINPQVEMLARKYFKFLSNYKGKTEIVIGDGRISLEKELKEHGSNQFDVLVVDAFSGDLIPSHLLTFEAVDLYLKHLNNQGVLAFHITNNYIDLIPVMCGISDHFNMPLYYIVKQADENNPIASLWVIFTANQRLLNVPAIRDHIQVYDVASNPKAYWTDDHSSVLSLIK